ELFGQDREGWYCLSCSSRDFYNSNTPSRRVAPAGTWVYVPRADPAPEPNGFEDDSPNTSWRASTLEGLSPTSPPTPARRPAGSFPGQEWAEGHHRETAESELATTDATVDPDTLEPIRRLSRRQRRAAAAAAGKGSQRPRAGPSGDAAPRAEGQPRGPARGPDSGQVRDQDGRGTWRGKLLKDMGELFSKKDRDSENDWSLSKGPKPGVRYRGGTPPQPPTWSYAREDVRAYDRYERKVRVWERQIGAFMPKNEAAMMLYVSLRGEAEEELEFMDMNEIDSPSGIENILLALKRPLQTRAVYLKRKYLHDYEYLGRNNNESIRSFCNRYHRVEKSLLAARIDVTGMYDSESRGSRLLDRMRLTAEQQRLILVATGQSLQFDSIRESAQLQFPEHRATPPVAYHREFEGAPSRAHGPPDGGHRGGGPKGGKDHGKGGRGPKGHGKFGKTHRAYVTEEAPAEEDHGEDMPGIPEEDDEPEAAQDDDNDDELIPEEDDPDQDDIDDVMREVAECLTVTARRLQGVTLGRKFSGGGKGKNVEQRKRNSHCVACGQKGHWQGDDICPVSAKGGRGTPSSSASASQGAPRADKADKKGAAPKRVFTVFHPAGLDTSVSLENSPSQDPEEHQDQEHNQEYGSYFTTFMTAFVGPPQEVFLSRPGDYAGFAVLDTACQRSLCSQVWLDSHRAQLKGFKLDVKLRPENEGFQFGTGPVQISKSHAYFPTCLDGTLQTCSLFGASVMGDGSEIPLLLSLGMISKKLKAVLDFPRGVAYLAAFDVEVPIVKISGHVCLALNKFPKEHFAQWKLLSSVLDQGEPDAEFVTARPTALPHDCIAASTSMASGVAQAGAGDPRRRDAAPPLHGTDSSSTTSAPRLAGTPGPDAPALDRQLDQLPADALRASRVDVGQERQSPRPFSKVLPVCNKVEMGARSVGRAALYTIAAAVASLSHVWSETGMGDPIVAGDGRAIFDGSIFGHPASDWFEGESQVGTTPVGAPAVNKPMVIPSGGLEMMEDQYLRGQEVLQQMRARAAQRIAASSAAPPTVPTEEEQEPEEDFDDTLTDIYDWKARENYDFEVQQHREMPFYKVIHSMPKIDIFEVFAGTAGITTEAHHFGLIALQPFDFTYGQDLAEKEQAEALKNVIRQLRPLFFVCRWPHKNAGNNKLGNLDDLYNLGSWACREQDHYGRFFLGEQAPYGGFWRHASATDLLDNKNVSKTTCHAGAYGEEDGQGFPTARQHQWISNSAAVLNKIGNKLTEEQLMYCREQADELQSEYPCAGLISSILQGVQNEARRRFPSRFQHKHFEVMYVRPLNDPEAWKQVLQEIEQRFSNTHKKPFNLNSGDPLREVLSQLVPWKIERVQAAWTPQSRRWPQDIPFTHRGAALMLTTGEVVIESEDLSQVTYPKQRFAKPIRVAIFFYGVPNKTPEVEEATTEEAPGQSSTRPLHGFETEIWFEDAPREVDKKLQYSLARLHVNMGHPGRAELIRMLAASGNLSRKVLLGLDSLRCGSCQRLQKPRPPPVSSVAPVFAGFFGEVLQADLVYIRVISGAAIPVLGLTCEATNYHASKALTSRNPAEVLQCLLEIWYRPLGLPLHFKCDAGGEFAAEVAAWHGRSGILHEVVPAEAHHRLGKIERRNSLMRTLTERVIDERGVHNIEELNKVLPAITFSMNSSTYSYGRSPFQAVFGRVPRPLGDLSSDPRALVLTPEAGEKRLAPELLRADALKALAEFNSSSAIRRALLRKTRHQDTNDFQAGQPVAYWRWSGRSRQHKKGAWNLGRFLSFDPDRKSLWLQVGTTTVKIASNQARRAVGWEEWTPTTEDIKILRDAENNLKDAMWEDHTEEPPGELQEPSGETRHDMLPPPELPRLQKQQDYWRYTQEGVCRVHVEPRRELYVPQPHECDFDLEDLAETRRTQRNEVQEQLPEDQWRDPLSHHEFEENNLSELENYRDLYHQLLLKLYLYLKNKTPDSDNGLTSNSSSRLTVWGPRVTRSTYTEEYQEGTRVTSNSRGEALLDSAQYESAQYDSAQYTSPAFSQGVPDAPLAAAPGTPDYTTLPPAQLSPPPVPSGHDTRNDDTVQETQPNLAEQPLQELPAASSQQEQSGQNTAEADLQEALPTLPQKRTADALANSWPVNFNYFDNGEVTLRGNNNDSDYSQIPFRRCYFYRCYLNSSSRKKEMSEAGVTEQPERSDESSDDASLTASNSRTHSRKELKQLDREIPWRQLTDLPKHQLDAYLEATRVENDNWMSWGGIQPISHREAKRIMGDNKLSKRILKSRAAYRDKSKGIGPLRPKCRVVIIGCADPDLFQISRDSPTPTRLSESLLMTIAAAGINKEFCGTKEVWFLWASDAKSAFLQGDQDTSERDGPLYMRPPRDPLIEATGSFPAELYMVTGNCYGLPNAPRVWYLRVHRTMLEHGFKRHSFDRCMYYYNDSGGKLQAVVIIHVDDFLATYSESFPLHILEKMFVWGSITKVTTEKHAVYRGKEIRLHQEGNRFKYLVTQSEFIEGMEGGKIHRGRGQQAPSLTSSEWADFRSVSGSLQWIAGQTRPEIAPLVSLSNRGKETDYKDLQRLYEAVEFLKTTPQDGLVYQDLALNKDSCFVTYTDSSFANAELKSQYGVLVFVSQTRVATVTTKGTLVDWKSARSTRVCRSTLAAEASAADEGSDRAGFANLCLSELFTGQQALKAPPVFPNLQVTDAKSLYDTVIAENPGVSDKRSLINIRSIQQCVKPEDFRWVPTSLMAADGLTKLDWKLTEGLNTFLRNPKLQLTDQVQKESKTSVKDRI
ncbi:TY5A, partial [Symbiodinium microadriaticum]